MQVSSIYLANGQRRRKEGVQPVELKFERTSRVYVDVVG